MDTLNSLYYALIAVILAGAAVRSIYCFIKITMEEDGSGQMVRRVKHVIYFTVISVTILTVVRQILFYYGFTAPIFVY